MTVQLTLFSVEKTEGGRRILVMAARMALEAAVMEAEPPPYPMSGREQEGYAKRPWDWEAVAYS